MQSPRGATPLARYLALVIIAGAALVLSWSFGDRSEVVSSSFEGISAEELAARGMRLQPLEPGERPSISRGAAKAIVGKYYPNVAVRETILGRREGFGTAVWAFRLDHLDEDLRTRRVPGSALAWVIVLIDADTGAFILSSWHGDPAGLKAALEAGEIRPSGLGATQPTPLSPPAPIGR